jgi:hypothetical protein
MSKKQNCSFNDDLQKEFQFIKLGNLCSDGAKMVCKHHKFIFPSLMEAEVTSTNIYIARNIRVLKILWLQLKTSAHLW